MADNKNIDLPSNLVSFVCDPVSHKIIDATIKEMGIAYAENVIGSIDEVYNFLKEHRSPKILLIDLSNSELPMSDVEKLLEVCSPEVSVLAIGSKNDVGLFRELLRFGVVDYLIKPLTLDLLKKTLSGIIQGIDSYDTTESRNGKIISFIGAVGGIGTTTLSTNCAWMLANNHFKRTVIIDGDFQFGNSSLLLDLKMDSSYLDMLESPDKIDDYFIETILKKHGSRLYHLGGLSDITRNSESDPETFSYFIDMVKKQFNYLVVDLPTRIDDLMKVLISKTKFFVVVADLSMASAYNAARILEYLKQESRDRHVIIVLNKVGHHIRGAISKDSFEKVIGMQVNHIIHFDGYTPYGAANVGQPLASLNSFINKNLEEIIQDLLGHTIISGKIKEVYEERTNKFLKKLGINNLSFFKNK